MFEQLESRVLLSATLEDGLLSVVGTEGKDSILLGRRGDAIVVRLGKMAYGFPASDVQQVELWALGGNDVIKLTNLDKPANIDAGAGNDRVFGGKGDDAIFGGAGNDRIIAGPGHDLLNGGAGKDILIGGAGNDLFYAADGEKDILKGGAGNDWADSSADKGFGLEQREASDVGAASLLQRGWTPPLDERPRTRQDAGQRVKTGAPFSSVIRNGSASGQFYSTASYTANNLAGIQSSCADLTNWDCGAQGGVGVIIAQPGTTTAFARGQLDISNSVLIQRDYGDADLYGLVDADDYAGLLTRADLQPGQAWYGDFNLDGVVDVSEDAMLTDFFLWLGSHLWSNGGVFQPQTPATEPNDDVAAIDASEDTDQTESQEPSDTIASSEGETPTPTDNQPAEASPEA